MKTSFALLLLFLAQSAFAQEDSARQDPSLIRQSVEQFLRIQTAGLPGDINMKIGVIDPRLKLTNCAALEPFLPAGSRIWGKTTVGVRCTTPAPWTIYLQVSVAVVADYFVAAMPLAQGQIIGPNDLVKATGDLTTLPAGIITDASQAIGRMAALSLRAGTALRQDALRSQPAVRQGQTVRLTSSGPGFRVSAEARALTSAGEGQMVQARTQTGQMVSGVAKPGGLVEVSY